MGSSTQRNLFCLIIVSLFLTYSSNAAGVQIRLAGSGSTQCSGRVEIYHNSTWGTVCDDNWDLNDATVVCRQLNCGTALSATKLAIFGKGTGPILLDHVDCSGSESSLAECWHRGFGTYNCGHNEDAGVVCSATLPKPSISKVPVGDVTWGQDVVITCLISPQTRQILTGTFILNQNSGSFRQTQTSSANSATFRILQVGFYEEGSYQCQYQMRVSSQNFFSPLSDSVQLSVTVPLQQPIISLTSPNGGLVWGPEGAQVTRGYSFVLTCIISSHYPGGRFSLFFSGSNITNTEPAVDQSASFNVPVAEDEHQGNYSCVYEVSSSTKKFISTMATQISVIIKLPLWVLVSSVAVGILVLFLLVLVVVSLVLRRRRAKQPGTIIQTRLTIRTCEDDNKREEEESDYVNVRPVNTNRKQTEQGGGALDEDSDDHDYEGEVMEDNYIVAADFVNIEDHREDQADEDDDNDYVNVTKPFVEQTVDLYREYDDIYQNL